MYVLRKGSVMTKKELLFIYTYARRIDDKLICIITISGVRPVDK